MAAPRSYVLGRFENEAALLEAARQMRVRGHLGLDLHSPVPIHGSSQVLGLRPTRIPLLALLGGLTGTATGFVMQWWMVGYNFPLNVGNRPPLSAPAFIPITFELGVLFSALAIFLGLLIMAGFPRTHHPVFEADSFRSASIDGLWLSAEVEPDQGEGAERALKALGALQTFVIPPETEVMSP